MKARPSGSINERRGRFLSPTGRDASIDGLRGLAALSVLAFHVWLYTLPRPVASVQRNATDVVFSHLRVGLVLFFVLSGFLLYAPWARAGLRDRLGRPPAVRDYARRRAGRILPAYDAALAGSVALLWDASATPGVRLPDPSLLPAFLVFAQNFFSGSLLKLDPPMWTLAVEVTFYALLPVAGWAALRLPRRTAWQALVPAMMLAIGVGWNLWLSVSPGPAPLTKILPALLPYFAVGMLGALVHAGGINTARHRGLLLAAGAVLVAGNAVWHALGGGPAAAVVGDLPAAVGFGAIVLGAVSRPAAGVLSWRPLAALGTISYSLYLWHVPLLLWLRHHHALPLSPWLALPLVLAASAAVAALSWTLLERPMILRAERRRHPPAARESSPFSPVGAAA